MLGKETQFLPNFHQDQSSTKNSSEKLSDLMKDKWFTQIWRLFLENLVTSLKTTTLNNGPICKALLATLIEVMIMVINLDNTIIKSLEFLTNLKESKLKPKWIIEPKLIKTLDLSRKRLSSTITIKDFTL